MSHQLAVLITYYNERELLTECLESLAAQTILPDEILIYDDASKFPAEKFVPEALPARVSIRVIRGEKNHGPSFGRNRLLSETTCDYVHFHDSDDKFLKGWTTTVVKSIEKDSPDVILTEIQSEKDGKLYHPNVMGLSGLRETDDLFRFCLKEVLLTDAGVYKKTVVESVGGYPETIWQAEDFYFHAKLALHGVRFKVFDHALISHRLHEHSRSEKQVEVWSSYLQGLKFLKEESPERYWKDIASAANRAGSILFRLREEALAGDAFHFAESLGGGDFAEKGRIYKMLSKGVGPMQAERFAAWYRSAIPGSLRALLSRLK